MVFFSDFLENDIIFPAAVLFNRAPSLEIATGERNQGIRDINLREFHFLLFARFRVWNCSCASAWARRPVTASTRRKLAPTLPSDTM